MSKKTNDQIREELESAKAEIIKLKAKRERLVGGTSTKVDE